MQKKNSLACFTEISVFCLSRMTPSISGVSDKKTSSPGSSKPQIHHALSELIYKSFQTTGVPQTPKFRFPSAHQFDWSTACGHHLDFTLVTPNVLKTSIISNPKHLSLTMDRVSSFRKVTGLCLTVNPCVSPPFLGSLTSSFGY